MGILSTTLENERLRFSPMYRTKNPALNDMVFVFQGMIEDKMTIQGVVEKLSLIHI